MSKSVAIISSGYFPVPAVRGGAVETLIEKIAISNEANKQFDLIVYSTFDKEAKDKEKEYNNTKFVFVQNKWLVEWIDRVIYYFAKKIIRTDKQMSFRFIMHRIAYIVEVAKQLKKNDYDYLIVENTATLFWCVKLFDNEKRYQDKIYYHLHNEIGSAFGCKDIISHSQKIIGVSSYINKTVKQRFPNIKSTKYQVLYNVIDVKHIFEQSDSRRDLRCKFGFQDADIVIIYVGRLCKEKGTKELIEAFNAIEQKNIKLLIVGSFYFGVDLKGDFEKQLHKLVEKKKNQIVFTGFVSNSDIGKYYHCADIAVLPSIWNEPAGLTMIEAMAAGLPVITTNSGGIPEYVGNDSAIIIDKNAENFTDNLKEKIIELANDSEARKTIGKRALEKSQKYDSSGYAKNLADILERGK